MSDKSNKNKYKVLKKIGEGAFGTVYKGVIKGTNNLVAITST